MKKRPIPGLEGISLFTLRAILYKHRYPSRKPPSRKDLAEPAWDTADYDRWVASLGRRVRREPVDGDTGEENKLGAK